MSETNNPNKIAETDLTARVIEDADDVHRLEMRLAIAQRRLDLSELELSRLKNPRQSGVVDIIAALLRPVVGDRVCALSSAVDIWLTLRRNGSLKEE